MASTSNGRRRADNAGRRITVGMGSGLASEVDAFAEESGETRSAAVSDLLGRGLPSVLRKGARHAWDAEAVVVMPDGSVTSLSVEFVSAEVLPAVAKALCGDPVWLDACPPETRSDMAHAISSAAAGLGTRNLPLSTVVSIGRVLASDYDSPWMVSDSTRSAAMARAVERITLLLSGARDGKLNVEGWSELAWRSATVLAFAVSDVIGRPPAGPVEALDSILSVDGGSGGLASELFSGASHRLADILTLGDAGMSHLSKAVGIVATSPIATGSAGVPTQEQRAAILALADAALGLSMSDVGELTGAKQKYEPERLSRKGTHELVDYVSAHPRATTSELLSATGLSRTTLRRRVAELEGAGLAHNAGSSSEPLWEVPGVEHEPEDLLTGRQVRVLAMMRRDPPASTAEIAAVLGISTSLVTKEYHRLASIGLVEKRGRRWIARPQHMLD